MSLIALGPALVKKCSNHSALNLVQQPNYAAE